MEKFKINSFNVTIVTDEFLSAFISESNGFSIVESPLISSSGYRNIIFSQVTYQSDERRLKVFKSVGSGRPVYYYINTKGEFFCSTHISMLRTAGVPIEENIDVLPEFFVYRYVMPPNTLYKKIEQLLGGGQLQIKIENDKCMVQSTDYYIPTQLNTNINSIKNGSEILNNFLSESIKKLDCCKDELAILLSGGIESSIISKICKNNFSINRSYSTGYPFESPLLNVEKRYALSAAAALGMQHSYYEPTTHEYLLGFIEAISFAEEPL
ncbi:MAG: asparagine synthase-related protein, partial [Euryarchaeota archaeon]|nr:asparagine synthase-related protein [Euryarchaeota archaeon]